MPTAGGGRVNGLGLRRPDLDQGERVCSARSAPTDRGTQWACTAIRDHGGPVHAALDRNGDVILDGTWPIDENWPEIEKLAIEAGIPAEVFGFGGLVLVDEPGRRVTLRVIFDSEPLGGDQ